MTVSHCRIGHVPIIEHTNCT